ncbi:MAG TPA: hypothetical protein VF200_14070 [Woeseiaceae bacterium]
MKNPALVASSMVALLVTTAALAQGVPDALRRCAAIDDDAARLACYDAYVAGARAAASAGTREARDASKQAGGGEAVSGAGTPSSDTAADRSAEAEARFGLPDAPEEEAKEITATITDIAEGAYGVRTFTLDNGQVWVEDSRARTLKLKVGDTVRISAGLFGSYRLRGSGNRSTSVDRIR